MIFRYKADSLPVASKALWEVFGWSEAEQIPKILCAHHLSKGCAPGLRELYHSAFIYKIGRDWSRPILTCEQIMNTVFKFRNLFTKDN